MKSKPAAELARVEFEVIDNPAIIASPVSADDWSFSQSDHPDDHPDHGHLWFKPGVFYFRRALRGCVSRERAKGIGSVVADELFRLVTWAHEQGVRFMGGRGAAAADLKSSLCWAPGHNEAVEAGLRLCTELESLQSHVALVGELIPPRWTADPDEAKENGWAMKEAPNA